MNDNFHSINVEITPTSNDQSRISFINILKRKKFVWITIGVIVILIILSISISLPIVMKKKKNVPQITAIVTTTTTTAAITAEELSFTSMSNNNYLKWNRSFSIVAGGNGDGNDLNQVSGTRGIYIDDEKQTIYIAAYDSDRIVGWKFGEESGKIVAGGNGKGNEINQLQDPSDVTVDKKKNLLIICDQGNKRVVQWSLQNQTNPETIIPSIRCTGVTIDNNGDIYVSEEETHSVKRFKQGEVEGTTVAGGHECGEGLNQLNDPAYIYVDKQYSIYVSNKYARVTKWIKDAKEGIIIAKEQIPEIGYWQSYPSGMAVDHFGNVYVSEPTNRQIMRWSEGSKVGYDAIDGENDERAPSLFSGPAAISLDREGNLYVVDIMANYIMKFDVDVN
ncbi:unnamed protein product [Adineta steineri]|uniref:NHL repeat containing protein n=1 Tax=Adineta steineri TaxID=433720 RepID=A0A814Z6I4_9BILA|nr:unnamed protein product [Adineta steineri]CAF4031276.1 unnamed protein product [Adineta steineri]